MSTVNREPLCKYTMCICCIILLWGLFARSVWWAVWMFWERSGVEATAAFSTAQGWPLNQACSVGLLTGMGPMHFTAPCDPPHHTHTYIVEVSSTWPFDLALWVAEDRNLKGIENGLTCLSFSASFFFFFLLHKPLSDAGYETLASLDSLYAG